MTHSRSTHAKANNAASVPLSIVLALTLFPYLQFGPLATPTEVQPWAALSAWVMFFVLLVRGRLRLTRFDIVIFAFSVVFLVYIPFGQEIDLGQYLRKAMAFVLSISLLVVARYLTPSLMISVLKPAVLAWFAFAVLGEVNPALYQQMVTPLVPGALGAFGERGVTSLSPEATDFGFVMVYFYVLAILASTSARARGQAAAPLWLYVAIVICILLSRSAAGVFGLTLVILVKAMTYNGSSGTSHLSLRTVILTIAVPFILIFAARLSPETGVRGIDLLITALLVPQELVQTTFSYRIAHNLVGLFGMLDSNLLGHGAGTFTVLGVDTYHRFFIGDLLGVQGWYQFNIPNTLQESALAIFPVILFEYGLLGLVFMIYLYSSVLTSNMRLKFVVVALLLMTWGQSFPVAFPLFWLLLGLAQNRDFQIPKAPVPGRTNRFVRSLRGAD